MARNYEREYAEYHSKPEQIKRRAERNKARAKAVKAGSAKKGDSKHVHHVNAPRTGSLAGSKTKVVGKATNLKIQPKRS